MCLFCFFAPLLPKFCANFAQNTLVFRSILFLWTFIYLFFVFNPEFQMFFPCRIMFFYSANHGLCYLFFNIILFLLIPACVGVIFAEKIQKYLKFCLDFCF